MSEPVNQDKVNISVYFMRADVAGDVAQMPTPTDKKVDVVEVHVTDSTPAATLEAISKRAEQVGAELRLRAGEPKSQ